MYLLHDEIMHEPDVKTNEIFSQFAGHSAMIRRRLLLKN